MATPGEKNIVDRCLEVRSVRGRQVVAVRGNVDQHVADEMREILETQVSTGSPILVDCSEVASIDSYGLSSLICARYAAAEARVDFKLFDISAETRGALTAAGVSGLFDLRESGRAR
ncbi:MAG: STAS domain-containing protein [Catenulispora sp.]|nr:STAS domain-containing protein [Catenulispora sp.]